MTSQGSLFLQASFHALAARTLLVDGVPTSLVDLGYMDAGLDDCWQKCGSYGPQKYTYHNATGWPQVDPEKFPSMSSMVNVAHSLGLRAGFYSNNCACKDHCATDECFASDAAATLAWGFDSIKLGLSFFISCSIQPAPKTFYSNENIHCVADGCGKEENVAKWRQIFNTTSAKPIMIENCHK